MEGVAFTRYPVSICLEVEPKMTKFKQRKSDKINLRVTAKLHAHLETLTKTSVEFQKDPNKIVGGVAFTRYPVPLCFQVEPKKD